MTTAGLARGLGRSYGDAALPAGEGKVWDARFRSKFIAFDPATGILEAESGVSLETILRYFIPKGFFLPVTPGTMFVTLGGAVASNVHGKNHHKAGSIENFIEGLSVFTPVGRFNCSPTEKPDLFRTTVGGYGLTGLIEKVRLRLRKVESAYVVTRNLKAPGLSALFDLFRQNDERHEFSVAWLDTLAKGRNLGRGILILGDHADAIQTAQMRDRLLFQRKPKVSVPAPPPEFFLNALFLSMFNGIFYALGKRGDRQSLTDYEDFFYPLDKILNWNRLYGKRGFFQYQFVIPDPKGEEGVEECLAYMAEAGMGSFLSVLKRCGDDTVGLPFARRGYTLALDIPFRGGETLAKMKRLDQLVLKYGGRVYLTKDARLSPETFRAMFPEFPGWRKIMLTYNPDRVFWSSLAERLRLSEP
jgi:decaprenylphospho-beta-D-ribofuranose 2-oxidase